MFGSQGSSLDALMFQGIADDPGNYDREACGPLLNPEEVRGKICVVTRGSCFFSSKTLACQRAGAVAAIIVNDAMDEGAADNWVTSHDPAGILIPTVSYGAVQGNQLLREMDTSAAVTVKLHSYACEPAGHCVACAPGFGFPEDNCTAAASPGVDDSRSTVCNNRGTCDVDPVNERAFACTCDPGFSGDACEIERKEEEDGEDGVNGTFKAWAGIISSAAANGTFNGTTSSGANAKAVDAGLIDDDLGALQKGKGGGRYSGVEIFGITLAAVALATLLVTLAGALTSTIRAKRRMRRIDLPALPSTTPRDAA